MRSRTLDPCTIIRVQSWDVAASAPSTIHQVLGTAWPHVVGAVTTGVVDVLCTGPTDWLIVGVNPNASALCATLTKALFDTPLRATDISHAYTRLEFEGPDVCDFLLKGCSLDLHPTRFPIARCARTRFAGVPTVLRHQAPSTFEAIVSSSYQQYLLAWIAERSGLNPTSHPQW
jgi:sarcosine oxidase, subunit gamma